MSRKTVTIEGNEATTYTAHKVSEVIGIYPITPSSVMGELADKWSAMGQKNIWGTVPQVTEMQSWALISCINGVRERCQHSSAWTTRNP